MKKIFLLLIALIPAVAFGQVEQINSFVSDIQINQDGSFTVTETIEYDFGTEEKRGIFRTIPLTYNQEVPEQKLFQNRYMTVEFLRGVTRGDADEPYAIESTKEEAVLRIGDPDITHTGVQTYQFSYLVSGALSYPGDITELYWNVTGNNWSVPVNNAKAIVRGPEGFKKDQATCYRGDLGSTETCEVLTEDQVVTFSTTGLGPYQGITAALQLDPTVITRQVLLRYDFSMGWLILIFVTLVVYARTLWKINREHFKDRPTVTMFDAPRGFSALFSGYVVDDILNPRDVSAGIVELAQLGYISVERKVTKNILGMEDAEYILTLQKTDRNSLADIQKELLSMLFGTITVGTTFSTKSSKIDQTTYLGMRASAEKELFTKEVIQKAPYPIALVAGSVAIVLVSLYFLNENLNDLVELAFFMVILLAGLAAAAIRRKTAFGHEAKKHLQGLQLYIKVAEKDRIAFHDDITKTTEIFSKLLPFAVAFGLEKQWTKAFKDIAVQVDWYNDGSGNNTLNTLILTDALSDLTSSMTSTMPDTSSSGGGGSSGGGSGGGGGGSW